MIIRYPRKVPAGLRVAGYNELKDLMPTLLGLAGVKTDIKFDGESLMQLVAGRKPSFASSMYLTECTWMRKHGWRTPQWKLIHALEPDFHFKPEIELYNLVDDPEESRNLARSEKKIVAMLEERMQAWIARREKETGRANPMYTNEHWTDGAPFKTSQEAYDTLHIGTVGAAARLQARGPKEE